MDYIVLDIEFNSRKFASTLPMEVIEIGAVRLNAEFQLTDGFSELIKPVYFSKLNRFVKTKTGISQEMIDTADSFPAVSERFISWLKQREPFLLVTWGGEDLKRIIFDTRMHKLDDSFWMNAPYYDLLKGYISLMQLSNDASVESALTALGLPLEGAAHRALDDARMTADILRAIADRLDWSRTQHFKDTYSNARERRMIRNAMRVSGKQRPLPDWEEFAAKQLNGKLTLEDPRKAAELKAYYEAHLQKQAVQPPD